jgi:hypothetical protein
MHRIAFVKGSGVYVTDVLAAEEPRGEGNLLPGHQYDDL